MENNNQNTNPVIEGTGQTDPGASAIVESFTKEQVEEMLAKQREEHQAELNKVAGKVKNETKAKVAGKVTDELQSAFEQEKAAYQARLDELAARLDKQDQEKARNTYVQEVEGELGRKMDAKEQKYFDLAVKNGVAIEDIKKDLLDLFGAKKLEQPPVTTVETKQGADAAPNMTASLINDYLSRTKK